MNRLIPTIVMVLVLSNGFGQSMGKIIKRGLMEHASQEMTILGLHNTNEKKRFKQYFKAGQLEFQKGNYPKAEEYFLQGYEIFKTGIIKKKIHYDLLDELALVYIKEGNYLKAQEFIDESYNQRNRRFSRNNPARLKPYLAKAELALVKGNKELATYYLSLYQDGIKYSTFFTKYESHHYANSFRTLFLLKSQDTIYDDLKKIARQNHHLQKHRWTKAQVGKNFLKRIDSKVFIAKAHYLNQDYEKAKTASDDALEMYNRKISFQSEELIALHINRGLIFEALGQTDSAANILQLACAEQIEFINRNFNQLSTYERKRFYERSKNSLNTVYQFSARTLQKGNSLPQGFVNQLFNTRLATKAIILSESNKLYEKLLGTDNLEVLNLFEQWKAKKNEYALLVNNSGWEQNTYQNRLIQEISELEKKLATHNRIFEPSSKIPTYEDIQLSLEKRDQAIEIIRTKEDGIPVYLSLSLQKTQTPSLSLLELSTESEEIYFKIYLSSIQYDIKDKKSPSIFLSPITDLVEESVTRLFLSPDGIYNQINLNLLQLYENSEPSVEIINLTNLKTLLKSRESTPISSALLLGRPLYYQNNESVNSEASTFRSGVNDLPGTETEILKIQKSLEAENITCEVLLKGDADESHLKVAKSADIIHFATHGFFDAKSNSDPMIASGLLLAGLDAEKESEDNVLTAYEASLLDLTKTQIAVLSACETGLGTIEDGEGVYGLQRAFEVAGVRYVLMSMWKVDDQATQELMTFMYQEFAKTNNLRAAFNHAQIELRKTHPEVSKWGAFKLIGN